MATYKVLVVDDSPFMRKIVSDLIEADATFQVIDTANNGLEATQKVMELKPDVVTMDVEMPEMNGLEALKVIMAQRPVPVIMLSGINEQGMRETIMALENGAFDFIRKPSVSNSQDIEEVGQQLLRQLNTAVHVLERRRKRAEQKTMAADAAPSPSLPEVEKKREASIAPPPSQAAPQKSKPSIEDSSRRPQPGTLNPPPAGRPAPPLNNRLARPGRSEDPNPSRPAVPPKTVEPRSAAASPLKPAEPKVPKPPSAPANPLTRKEPEKPSVPSSSSSASSGPIVGKTSHTDVTAASIGKLVAVGCSTGGPRALKSFLEKIPANFPAPIVIVQHMPPNFTRSLAQRLNSLSQITVVEAEQGMPLQPGTAYIAPGGYHMTVVRSQGGYRIQLTQEPPRNGHRPSVDTLFASIRPFSDLQRYAVIMTGMGSDGAKEMKNLYDSGVIPTFAENEDTCVVYGMPRSAVELGCVNHLLPLPEIAPKLVQIVK
ncbi:protein-glutamate methylesterase/protein-glutamine glutaminase [Paenibacillus bovis]|uniref:Protein-glutamate methylesterase/protein-glutamine glutaminase n=1 Tax=Paenibacillus bovis TaxID=1616788 RepID=A0A172ZG76_9BACL|nr:chemotaxis response regulator protein-glutamate methylesterase [Paenibacillus bovis]ANF96539.1 chemotaxis response regulator protein-glutamate methylesterase [Paenibacillus bovis]